MSFIRIFAYFIPTCDRSDHVRHRPHLFDYRLMERIENRSILLNHRRTMSMISFEIENARFTDPDDLRQFKGIWTFDMTIVAIMHDWLASLVDARLLADAEKAHDFEQRQTLIGRSYERFNTKVSALLHTATSQHEIATAIKSRSPRSPLFCVK